jgi:hypothetical protein
VIYVAVDSQRRHRESNEYEQTSGRRGQGLAPGARTQEGVDRHSLRGVTHIRVSVHRVAPGSGITIRQRWGFQFHRGPFSRSWDC